ncbi:Universal stress protein F [bacterium HR40]|nr:Universal stress protein F [bacterium HR40]
MFRDILVPVDLHDPEIWQKALETAVTLAETFGARLHLQTVLPDVGIASLAQYFPPDWEEKMRASALSELEKLAQRAVPETVEVSLLVSAGSIWREIVRAAEERGCDLVVMGSHRPGLRDYLIGANAIKVAEHVPCSVMVVRG